LPFVDVPPASARSGRLRAIGTALNARRHQSDYRTYVLLGDGESAEGSVWEAADVRRDKQPRQPLLHHRRHASARAARNDVGADWRRSPADGAPSDGTPSSSDGS